MEPRRLAIYAVVLVVVFALVIVRPWERKPSLTDVLGPIPAGARPIPSINLDSGFVERVMVWSNPAGTSPSYNDYQRFSESYWSQGLRFEGTFWLPTMMSEWLNLTNMDLRPDPSGEYLLVPYTAYLGVHNRYLWVYAIIEGLYQNPYDVPTGAYPNHQDLFHFGILIQQEQYGVRWFEYTQLTSGAIMYYNMSDPDAWSVPLNPASFVDGWAPVLVDNQFVRAHGTIGARLSRLSEWTPSDFAPFSLGPTDLLGNVAIMESNTVFVMGIRFDFLPHTPDFVVFTAMFSLTVDLPSASYDRPHDYDPTGGYSPNGWNNTIAYRPLYAPMT